MLRAKVGSFFCAHPKPRFWLTTVLSKALSASVCGIGSAFPRI